MESLFACLITVQFLVVVLHDLVDIPGWTHGQQVRSTVGQRQFWLGTMINAIFPGLAVAFAVYFWSRPKPEFVSDYWLVYSAVTLASAMTMWYVPYFFGTTEARKTDDMRMYAGTRHILPPRGDNPRPNLLHVCFHVLFAVNLLLAFAVRFHSA